MPKYTAVCGSAGIANLLGCGLLAAAIVMPYWVTDGENHIDTGLWQDCDIFPEDCNTQFGIQDVPNHPGWLNVVRVLLVLAWLLSFISFLGFFCICCTSNRMRVVCMQLICNILSTCLTIAGLVYFSTIISSFELEYGLSHHFTIGAVLNFLGAAAFSAVDRWKGDAGAS